MNPFGHFSPETLVVLVNLIAAAGLLVLAGWWLARGGLSVTEPTRRQIVAETALGFFVGKAREMSTPESRTRVMHVVPSVLATAFLLIVFCNMVGFLPLPVVNRPPTSYFAVTLGMALTAVGSTLAVSAVLKGVGPTLKHLFWPNPMQWVSEITDVMSLSLRLFGNIAGEYLTVSLVLGFVPWLIPLVLHMLGLIPAFVQALVFTLLTASFMAAALGGHAENKAAAEESSAAMPVPAPRPDRAVTQPAAAASEGSVTP